MRWDYFRCANIAILVTWAILLGGTLLLGSGASDAEIQAVGILGFAVGFATLVILSGRADRRRDSDRKH